jgi:amidophosphoribosyltransferase
VCYPNVYGIDMPTSSELVAHARSHAELTTLLAADRLIFQDLEDLIEAVRAGNPKLQRFDTSVFTGEYVTQDVSQEYLSQLELFRSETSRGVRRRRASGATELEFSASV